MGPVSFERLGDGLERDELLSLAGSLRRAGITVQAVDGDTVLLIRSEDLARARAVLDGK